jgi:WD40 repeat protein
MEVSLENFKVCFILITVKDITTTVYTLKLTDLFVFSGGSNGLVIQWTISSGEYVKAFTGNGNTVYDLVVNTNNDTLISGSGDGLIMKWRINSGELVNYDFHYRPVFSIIEHDFRLYSGEGFLSFAINRMEDFRTLNSVKGEYQI